MSITLDEFFKKNQLKIDVFKRKYMSKDDKYVDNFFLKIVEKSFNVSCENKNKKKEYVEKIFNDFINDVWRPGGSIMASLNKDNRKISVFNCTTIPIEGDTLEDIANARYYVQKCAAYRQGIGIDFSKLRPQNAPISNSAEISEGVVSWMRSFDRIADEVGQRARKPALLFSLSIFHPDIYNFISCKDNLNFINNANISVHIPDIFMKKFKNKENIFLYFFVEPFNLEIKKEVNSYDLFLKISEHAWKTGEPGLQFIDIMKKNSIQIALGYDIVGTNACSEKPLPPYGVCALASINLSKLPSIKDEEKFHSFLKEKTENIVRFMDNIVQYELDNSYKSPIDKQYKIVRDLREIGIGFTNLHYWLFKQGIDYASDEAIEVTEKLAKYLAYYSFRASIELAKERGACPAFIKLKKNGKIEEFLNKSEYLQRLFYEFPDLKDDYLKYGIRNGALLSIAPTGTISLTFSEDLLSYGIEPAIAWYYWKKTRVKDGTNWEYYFVLPEITKQEVLKKIKDTNSKDYEIISNFPGSVLDNDGKIGENIISIINKYLDIKKLTCALNMDFYKKIDLISAVQKWVDGGISTTFNLPESVSKEDVLKIYELAYEKKIKCITVYRNNSRDNILFIEFPENSKVNKDTSRPETIIYMHAPLRPKILKCEIHRIFKHSVIVGLMDNKPYEVFIVNDIIKNKKGYVEKTGKRKYILYDENKNIILKSILNKEVSNDEIQAITRLVSTSLRHGVPIDFIYNQLIKCGKAINTYPKMLARILKKYNVYQQTEYKISNEKCPRCSSNLLKYDGCMICNECGFSVCS